MLQAKVRDDSPLKSITACSGMQFNPRVWMDIPPGFEEEALSYPFLETRSIPPLEEGQAVDGEITVEKPAAPQKGKKSKTEAKP